MIDMLRLGNSKMYAMISIAILHGLHRKNPALFSEAVCGSQVQRLGKQEPISNFFFFFLTMRYIDTLLTEEKWPINVNFVF